MVLLEMLLPEELAEDSVWGDPPPPQLEDQEMDVLAFELWQRGSRQDLAAEDDCSDDQEIVGCHASCL
jgi:hypothetical protein